MSVGGLLPGETSGSAEVLEPTMDSLASILEDLVAEE